MLAFILPAFTRRASIYKLHEPRSAPLALVLGLSSVHMVASGDGRTRKGDTITYTADVSNVGNTCLTDVQVTEQVLDGDLDCGIGKFGAAS